MTSTAIVILTLNISIVLFVFSFGMKATLADATFLFRRPDKLLSALVSMYMAMPLFAVVVAQAFDLPPAVKIALVAFSVSPIPPLVPNKALIGGDGRVTRSACWWRVRCFRSFWSRSPWSSFRSCSGCRCR